MIRQRKSLYIFILVMLAAWPGQSIDLFVSTISVMGLLFVSKLYARRTLLFSAAICFIVLASGIRNGPEMLLNAAFSLMLLLPICMLVLVKRLKINLSLKELKRLLELFLSVEVVVTLINAAYFLMSPRPDSQMIDFGDLISGTMHYPFTYHADSANKTFTFLMIVTLALYLSLYGRKAAKTSLVALCGFVIVLSGVNHLIILGAIATVVAYSHSIKKIAVVTAGGLVGLIAFAYVNPKNFVVVGEKMSSLFAYFGQTDDVGTSIDKLAYFVRSWQLFLSNPISLLLTGVGPGTYASRAAELLGGTIDPTFAVHSASKLFDSVTGPLYAMFDAKPQYQKGAFYFPYDDVVSLSVEYGVLFLIVLNIFIFIRVSTLQRRFAIFFTIFLIGAGLVDHYYEYTAAILPISIFILLACNASSLCVEDDVKSEPTTS